MNTFTAKRLTTLVALTCALSMTACGNMSTRDKSTAIGAGIGAIGGAVLTGGSALGTVGGAAVGGVIGNQVGKQFVNIKTMPCNPHGYWAAGHVF